MRRNTGKPPTVQPQRAVTYRRSLTEAVDPAVHRTGVPDPVPYSPETSPRRIAEAARHAEVLAIVAAARVEAARRVAAREAERDRVLAGRRRYRGTPRAGLM